MQERAPARRGQALQDFKRLGTKTGRRGVKESDKAAREKAKEARKTGVVNKEATRKEATKEEIKGTARVIILGMRARRKSEMAGRSCR